MTKLVLVPIALLVASCDVTQPVPVADVTISPSAMDIGVGGSRQLEPIIVDAGGNVIAGRPITWTSTATSVASVSVAGIVTAKSLGTATVTATVDGISGSVQIRVPAQQQAMDQQVAFWVEEAIGIELYNGYVVKTPIGPKNISTGCPNGGSVVITGTTAQSSQTNQVNLVFAMDGCRVNTTTEELRITGKVAMSGSWNMADNFESLIYAAADSATISGTARLPDGTLYSVSEKCVLSIARTANAAGTASTFSGRICGRPF